MLCVLYLYFYCKIWSNWIVYKQITILKIAIYFIGYNLLKLGISIANIYYCWINPIYSNERKSKSPAVADQVSCTRNVFIAKFLRPLESCGWHPLEGCGWGACRTCCGRTTAGRSGTPWSHCSRSSWLWGEKSVCYQFNEVSNSKFMMNIKSSCLLYEYSASYKLFQ